MSDKKRPLILLLLAALVLSGCLAGSRVLLQTNTELTEAIEQGQVSSEYNYFYSGPQGLPDALLGLKKQYTLTDSFWKPIDLTSELLKNWVNAAGGSQYLQTPFTYHGRYLYTAQGELIGIWYGYQDRATIRQDDENTFTIFTPPARNLVQQRRFSSPLKLRSDQ